VADEASRTVLLSIPSPFGGHNGGQLTFGPGGFLYWSLGDGDPGLGDICELAQDDAEPFGKLLRINVNAPPANPVDAIWAKGLRNPWRFSFDRATGDLYVADVGQDNWEEINFIHAPVIPGANYGWDVLEGGHCWEPPTDCSLPGAWPPALEYCHDATSDPGCGTHPRGCSITGGYVSLAVEFKDHVVVLEGGQSEARGIAVIAETKRVIPNKPIKYVVNSHAHFDHASGLAPFAADGITIITHKNNQAYLEKVLSAPRTLVGDNLAKSNKKPKVESAGDKRVLKDETHTVELYHIQNLQHSDGMLVAYLPKEKILFTADFNIPAQGQPPAPAIATLVQNIERLKLDFEGHVLVHAPNPDRPMTRADLITLAKGTQ
jgi:glyoxylase-like metal-dependent hydrolase (beta-lactamase superfamily II)